MRHRVHLHWTPAPTFLLFRILYSDEIKLHHLTRWSVNCCARSELKRKQNELSKALTCHVLYIKRTSKSALQLLDKDESINLIVNQCGYVLDVHLYIANWLLLEALFSPQEIPSNLELTIYYIKSIILILSVHFCIRWKGNSFLTIEVHNKVLHPTKSTTVIILIHQSSDVNLK